MALIYCVDCGNKISDKAKQCPKCGCPIEESIKLYCDECGNEVHKNDKACLSCGCPLDVVTSIENTTINNNNNSNQNNNYEKEFEITKIEIDNERIKKYQTIVLVIAIVGFISIICPIYCLILYYIFGTCRNNILILTNKRIKGRINVWFTTATIDIPLDRIDNIYYVRQFGENKVIISSSSGSKSVMLVKNGEEFCKTTMQEIEKYKRYIYSK